MTYEHLNTPCFIINKEELEKNIDELHTALKINWDNYIIGYSFKTNSLPWIVNFYKKNNCYAEVVSESEYKLALKLEYEKNKIIYNGPIKYKELFLDAIVNGSIVNIDSQRELRWLSDLPQNKTHKIGLRVNFDIEEVCPGESACGSEGGRFGFSVETGALKEAVDLINQLDNVELVGLHLHISSKTRSLNIYKAIAEKVCEIKNRYNLTLEYIDVGGGFFGGLPTKPSFAEYIKIIKSILEKEFSPLTTTLIVEPGASVVGSPIDYLCRVMDVKTTNLNRFVITNGSRIHIDPLMHKNNYFYHLREANPLLVEKQVICGFTCMENDRILTLTQQEELVEGSFIIFNKVGAYTMCLSPLFIDYFPIVYLKDGNDFKVVREKWTESEYIQKCEK